jgi:hypothetical protein
MRESTTAAIKKGGYQLEINIQRISRAQAQVLPYANNDLIILAMLYTFINPITHFFTGFKMRNVLTVKSH